MVVQAVIPATQEIQTGGSQNQGQPRQLNNNLLQIKFKKG